MFKKICLALLLLVMLSAIGAYFYLQQTYPQTSPLLSAQYYVEKFSNPRPKLEKHVMGFLPYWRIEDIPNLKPHLLSEINYFSITAGYDGQLVQSENGETDPGWNGWSRQEIKDMITRNRIIGTDTTVTIAALNNDRIESILDSQSAQDTLIKEIVDLVKTNHLDGVNIDFEYFGEIDPSYTVAFTEFSTKLSKTFKKELPDAYISLSVMPLAVRENDLYQFAKLAPLYDYFLGMSYDFYGEKADIAGPIAPMRGYKDGKYFFDVETMYEDFMEVLPSEKIVMGVPYYGWDRAVEDGKTINSLTFPSDHESNYAAVISYARGREETLIKPKQCAWDAYAEETWCWYTKDGVDHQVWLADNKSVAARFNYANKQKLGGVGIWVLGYDKNYPDLWNMIKDKFSN